MQNKTSYYKIGFFTVLSLALVIAFLIALGMGHLFQPHVTAETYFNESVQGLDIGSPVKYRGVTVGKVTKISMINDIYSPKNNADSNQEQRYIYVQFSLSSQLPIAKYDQANIGKTIQKYVKNGLRASLATQDLVGNVFLLLNFVDKEDAAMLPISWIPESIYIPSTPSTLSQVTDSISNIAARLDQINFEKIMNDFDHLTITLKKSVEEIQKDHLSQKLSDALTETSTTMRQLNSFSTEANIFIANQQKNWDSTFSELHQMSFNLASMSNTLKNNPSAAIFGAPAEPMDPSQ